MSRATYPLKLPNSVKDAAARLAKRDGVSLNQWIASAVAQKVGVIETAESFLKRRAGNSTGEGFAAFLDRVPSSPAEPQDEPPRR